MVKGYPTSTKLRQHPLAFLAYFATATKYVEEVLGRTYEIILPLNDVQPSRALSHNWNTCGWRFRGEIDIARCCCNVLFRTYSGFSILAG